MEKDNLHKTAKEIFRRGSKTFYTSSLFFPPQLRREVTILYSFVRTADDFVDRIPQDVEGFQKFRRDYESALENGSSGNPIIDSFVELSRSRGFEVEWTASFLDAMEMDLRKSSYPTLEELLNYIYGSAETVGLMMARLMHVPEDGYNAARLLGRAFQYINFVRDIKEDLELGRVYLPAEDLERCGLEKLLESEAAKNPAGFADYIAMQCKRYWDWRNEAEKYFCAIPKKARPAVVTATDMYDFTATAIQKNPLIVFERKVKPSRASILIRAAANAAGEIFGGR